MESKLIVEQKITAFANQYLIYSTTTEGEKENLLAFAHQKRLAFKEKVTFYSDPQKSQEVFSFRAEKAMDIHGRFFVEDEKGKLLGSFKKDFKKSLLSSTWHILDGNKAKLTITESSKLLAIIRRVAGLIPIIGEILDILVAFFKYHFIFRDIKGHEVGRYQKTALFRDNYKFSMKNSIYKQHDWRVYAAMCVALDALQGR